MRLAYAAISLMGTGRAALPGTSRHTLEHGGLARTYRLHVPLEAPERPLPLVLVLHGGGGSGDKVARITHFEDVSDRHGLVSVFPDGIGNRWNDGRHDQFQVDDVGFLLALIDEVRREVPIDPARVYVAGVSNGGMLALRLACEATDRIAAIAPVIAAFPEGMESKCTPSAPMPVLVINGEADPVVPWDGGQIRLQRLRLGRILSTRDTVNFWVRHNGCTPKARVSWLPDTDPADGTRVRVERYTGGTGGAEVVLYAVEGGGHTWPGGEQYMGEWLIGKTSRDFDASETIWEFFSRFRREQP